ncbi:MAG: bifunctional UDP-N-acetylglucosamine diphosphorylase/glucosamine-1-phosphate N-acetyltransferase GlmU [Acidobacteriota bacterium]|nr:bifunctional UDP-N-acetylglucosamine diphosphorylase/glucosamine-1-phosphate N-acetyltransferase GlmU [Acidobacteriota bacterium]
MARKPSRTRASESSPSLVAVILAAGEGKRMKSALPKVLHPVAGRPMVEHVVLAARRAGATRVVVVVGHGGGEVERVLRARVDGPDLRFATQRQRRGTADAVSAAAGHLRGVRGEVLILCGDVPSLPGRALKDLVRRHRRRRSALTVLTAALDDPAGYGRIVRGEDGTIEAIVEHRDADPQQRAIHEINTGTYCATWPALRRALRRIRPDNAQGEYYLTDAVRELLAEGLRVEACLHQHPAEALGVNSRRHLAEAHRVRSAQVLDELMARGVTILDPATTWVHDTVRIGRDTVIHPGVCLEGATRIGKNCVVRSGCRLTDVDVADRAILLEGTVATDSSIGAGTQVGPYAHLRPGTRLGPACKVGNFVETKKARFGRGSKASHLSYIGDAEVGRQVNIGAGTITCNYDGTHKHRTELGDGVFIGSDTQLVAPVRVGKGAYVGAGATITRDVPAGALAISRAEQKNIEGWVARKKRKMAAKQQGGGGKSRR